MIIGAGLTHQESMCKMLIGKIGCASRLLELSNTLSSGNRYHRVDPLMEKFLPMDDPSVLETLIEIAEAVDLEPTKVWIERNFY